MMHNTSYKFSFLVSWCILLSISVVTLVAVIAKQSSQRTEENGSGRGPWSDGQRADSQGSVDHIHLVLGGSENSPWTNSSSCFCENTSLKLQNDSVHITTGGFYHTYAQVTFIDKTAPAGTVTLVANENVPGKSPRKLIEAESGNAIVAMTGVILLKEGDNVKLNIPPSGILKEVSKTYWGLFLLK